MVGIVIPTLNSAATLAQTLASLQAVSGVDRILIVDSGSADGTCGIANRHGVEVVQTPREGMYAAINVGLRRLDAEWLTYVNGDDVLYDVERLLEVARREAADIVYGTVDFIDVAGRFIHSWTSASPGRLMPLYRAGCSPLLQQGTLFRRHVFDTIGGFDSRWRFVGDADFWLRALSAGFRFSRLASPTVAGFRLHSDQLSRRHAAEMRDEFREMLALNGIRPWWPQTFLQAGRYRAGHIRQYLQRFLRHADLAGRPGFRGSYDTPVADATKAGWGSWV
jgi:glycosyltransferase involved in cell wall biosynthesis